MGRVPDAAAVYSMYVAVRGSKGYRCGVRYVLVVVALVVGTAHADVEAEFAACKARRRELTREAMKIEDVIVRGRKLALMPICRRFADEHVEVVGPVPPPPPPPSLSEVRPQVGLVVGMGTYLDNPGIALPATFEPFFQLEAGGRFRALSVVGFGGYTRVDASFDYLDPKARASHYDAHNTLTDGGVKLRLSSGAFAFGAGLGVEQEHVAGVSTTEGLRDYMHDLALIEGDVGYAVVSPAGFALRVRAIGSTAAGHGGGAVSSLRFALAVER